MSNDRPLIVREICLGDAGPDLDDIHLAECVNSDGRTSFWVLGAPGEAQTPTRIPDHEQVGALPWLIRERLDALPVAGRCNAPTKAGRRCRRTAAGCPHHRPTT
jgi:hypothetical protein